MRVYLPLLSVFCLAVGAAAQIRPLPTNIIVDSQNNFEFMQDRKTAKNTLEAKAATISSLIGASRGNIKFVGNGKGGFSQEFERATLYTELKSTTAYAVNGAILSRYLALGGPKSVLGFPTSDWTPAGDNRGWYNTFKGGGAIYWTPHTDAHEIYGNIYAQWTLLGRERSWLGYPITGEQPGGSGSGIERISAFEHGFATWNTRGDGRNGTIAYRDLFVAEYNRLGGTRSQLGLPHDRAMGYYRDGLGAVRIAFRGGTMAIPFDHPLVNTEYQAKVVVKIVGLECAVRQEKEDELSGALALFVPSTRSQSFVVRIADWRFKDGVRIWPIRANNVLYDGPPADFRIFSELVEIDNSNAGNVADSVVRSMNWAISTAIGHLGAAGNLDVPKAYEGEDRAAQMRLQWSLGDDIKRSFPNDNVYPEGRLLLRAHELRANKQTLRRGDDPNVVTYTHRITMEGVDFGGDKGIYNFYLDVDYVDMHVPA